MLKEHRILEVRLRDGTVITPDISDDSWWVRLIKAGAVTVSFNWVAVGRPLAEALENNPWILYHEAVHVVQAYRAGPLWLLQYVWRWVLSGFKYRENTFEADAFAREKLIAAGRDLEISSVTVL